MELRHGAENSKLEAFMTEFGELLSKLRHRHLSGESLDETERLRLDDLNEKFVGLLPRTERSDLDYLLTRARELIEKYS